MMPMLSRAEQDKLKQMTLWTKDEMALASDQERRRDSRSRKRSGRKKEDMGDVRQHYLPRWE
jgi:hypothetical protein